MAFRHWRVYMTSAHYPALEECEYYDASGTYISAGGTPTASDETIFSPASGAFDRALLISDGHWWGPPGPIPHTGDQWLAYFFGSAVDVAVVRLVERETSPGEAPDSVKIQRSSNGSSYADATPTMAARFGNDSSNHNNAWSFAVATPAAGAYCNWRVRATAPPATGSTGVVNCATLAFHETPGGPDLTSSVPQYALGKPDAFLAFDRDASTQSENTNAPGDGTADAGNWLGFAFERAFVVREICWTMPNSGGAFATKGPTTVAVEGSNDGGVTWTTAWTDTFGAWTADGQTQCIGAPGLTVVCDSPPDGTVGTSYSHAFPASNGVPPYTFSVLADTLPPGLAIDPATGIVSGIPTLSGTFAFVVDVSDNVAGAASVACSITIGGMTLGCGATPNGLVGVAYEDQLVVSAGVPPYVFTLLSGTLPPGLSLNPTTGEITGTPTTPGTYCFTVQVTEGAPAPGSGGFVLQVTVNVVHGLNSTSVSPGVWDDSGNVIKFGTVKLTDANTAILTFPVAQSGSFKLSADTFQQGFLGATSVSVPHGLNSLNLIPVVYDGANNVIDFGTFELVDVNNALLTCPAAQDGNLVILLPTGAYSQTFAPASSIPVPHNLNSKLLRVAVYDTSDKLIAYESFGPFDVNNSVLTFPAGSPQAGRVVVRVP